MNNISLHTSLAHIFFIVPVKIKSDCAEFDNGHAIAEYSTPPPNNNERVHNRFGGIWLFFVVIFGMRAKKRSGKREF